MLLCSSSISTGARDGVSKIVFLITDGKQNPEQSPDGKVAFDPDVASQPLIDRGMNTQFLNNSHEEISSKQTL